MKVELDLLVLAELLFPSLDLELEREREWAARNITDYHTAECRVITASLAYAIREQDPSGEIFHVQITGENNKVFILWRANAWQNSRHRIIALRTALNKEKAERDKFQTANKEEIAYRKQCVDWLSRVASAFCDINVGYKVSWLRDSFHKLASRTTYDMDKLYSYLIEILEEEYLKQVWVGAPQRKQNEQTEQTEVAEVSTAQQEESSSSRQAAQLEPLDREEGQRTSAQTGSSGEETGEGDQTVKR